MTSRDLADIRLEASLLALALLRLKAYQPSQTVEVVWETLNRVRRHSEKYGEDTVREIILDRIKEVEKKAAF